MKHVINKCIIVLASIVLISEGCSKTNDTAVQQTITDPSNIITSGSWVISTFSQRSEDKSAPFQGYTFTFATGGGLKAEINGAVTNGSWSYVPSSIGYYGSTPSKSSLTINLGSSKPLSSLTRTWNIDSTSTTSTKLALINPEVAEGMILNFSKSK